MPPHASARITDEGFEFHSCQQASDQGFSRLMVATSAAAADAGEGLAVFLIESTRRGKRASNFRPTSFGTNAKFGDVGRIAVVAKAAFASQPSFAAQKLTVTRENRQTRTAGLPVRLLLQAGGPDGFSPRAGFPPRNESGRRWCAGPFFSKSACDGCSRFECSPPALRQSPSMTFPRESNA
jgi:hypothetical protein